MSSTTRRPTGATASAPSTPLRRVGRRGLVLDGVVAFILSGLLLANGYLMGQMTESQGVEAPTLLTYASGLTMCLALALRRVLPLTVFVVVSVAFTVYGFNQGYDVMSSSVALFIATVSAGSHGRPVLRDWARGIVIAGLFGTIFYAFAVGGPAGVPTGLMWFTQVYSVVLNVFYFGAAWILGDQIRLRHQREADLARRTAELTARGVELEAERERSAAKATTDERLRIARELHDILGHHVSVMGVQAGAARRVLDRDPDAAGQALQAIEDSSRQAVTELQRVLRLLREPDDDGRGPPGALGRLDEIVDEVRRAGVAVTVQMEQVPTLPVELDLAAVRVVQESLTNALRHAGPGSSAWIRIRATDDTLELEVNDDGRGTPLTDPRGADEEARGSGLDGMRERVELHGGTFTAGPVPGRGWRVAARLPRAAAVGAAATTEPTGSVAR